MSFFFVMSPPWSDHGPSIGLASNWFKKRTYLYCFLSSSWCSTRRIYWWWNWMSSAIKRHSGQSVHPFLWLHLLWTIQWNSSWSNRSVVVGNLKTLTGYLMCPPDSERTLNFKTTGGGRLWFRPPSRTKLVAIYPTTSGKWAFPYTPFAVLIFPFSALCGWKRRNKNSKRNPIISFFSLWEKGRIRHLI